MTLPTYTNLRTPSPRPLPATPTYIYVRNAGNDSNPGTLAAPLATLKAALDKVPTVIDDAYYVIDVTSYQQTASAAFYFPPKLSGLPIDLAFTGQFFQDSVLAPLSIVATPDVYATLTVTGQAGDAVTTLRTLTTSDNYTLNELQGKFVRSTAALGQWGVVASNTAGPNSTVYVTYGSAMTAPIEILDLSCELALGDITDFYNRTAVCSTACPIGFTGIKLSNTNVSGDVALYTSGPEFKFQFCEIAGLYQEIGLARFNACYFNGGVLSPNGTTNSIYQSYLKNVNIQYHGGGDYGGQAYYWCVAEGCTPLGHYNNFQSAGGFDIGETEIISPKVNGSSVGAATLGIYYRGGAHGRVRNVKIGGATQGIYCEGPGYLYASNVENGAVANTDVGCELTAGAQAINAGSGVSGAAGEVRVGAAGIVTWGTPTTDPTQLCRLG